MEDPRDAKPMIKGTRMEMDRDVDLVQALTQDRVVVLCAAFSPNCHWLAVGGVSAAAHLWNLDTMSLHGALALPRTVTMPSGGFTTLAFSPDGRTLAAGGWYTVCLWGPDSGTRGQVLKDFAGKQVSALAFSPDGRTLAVAVDRCVQLWDPDTGTLRRLLPGCKNFVHSLAFSPDGRTVVSGHTAGNIYLWDPNTGALQGTLGAEDYGFITESLAFSSDGTFLAAGGYLKGGQGTVRLWDWHSGSLQRTLAAGAVRRGQSLAFSPDGRALTSVGENAVRLWAIGSGHRLHTRKADVQMECVGFSSDGRTLVSCDNKLIIRQHRIGVRSGSDFG